MSPDTLQKLAFGESDAKEAALATIVNEADESAIPLLQTFADPDVTIQTSAADKKIYITKDGKSTDAATGKTVDPLPDNLDDVIINNVMRNQINVTIAALKLTLSSREVRLAAAKELQGKAEDDVLPALAKALAKEGDPEIKELLTLTQASIQLHSKDKALRLKAIGELAQSSNPNTKTLLLGLLEKKGDVFAEPDADIRSAAQLSLGAVQGRLSTGERIGQVFSGISLGSILLLAALGLAITYGLMGVINMAHGELIMVGAYATYVVQNLFRNYLPGGFDWYLLVAVPVSFMVAAAVGMILERLVIRWLYGRPLETLLATWGISLMLIQGCRTIFGAQNVQVENPVWMSGGIEAMTGVVLPYSRIVIIGFAFAVLLLVWLMLTRTRLGLFVRAVTQNRRMAACVGVPTRRIDTWCFGLGSGIAGLAGCALSQIGNVGPDLGQNYIVDSFMVVVLGGVGQLAGTVYAAMGLGIANKFLEGVAGAVLAKICGAGVHHHIHPEAAAGAVRHQGAVRRRVMPKPVPYSLFSRLYGPRGWIAVAVLAVIAFVVFPLCNLAVPEGSFLHVSDYAVALMGKMLCYAMVALAMDLIWGYTGILSLGHGVFFASGGYAMGMYLMRAIGHDGVYKSDLPDFMVFLDWKAYPWYWSFTDHFWYAASLVVLVPGVLAFVFGFFAFRSRIKGVYFSIITQAMTFAFMLLFFRNDTGFGGNNGFTDFKRILGYPIATSQMRMFLFCLSALVLIAMLLMARYLVTSKLGRVLTAIRDAESRVMFSGYNPVNYKLFIWTLSAVMCGIAGALYVPQVGIINPSEMSPANSIEIAIWVAVGGRGTLVGAILGAGIVTGAKSWFTVAFPEYWLYFLGALFILVTIFLPTGVTGWITGLAGKAKRGAA